MATSPRLPRALWRGDLSRALGRLVGDAMLTDLTSGRPPPHAQVPRVRTSTISPGGVACGAPRALAIGAYCSPPNSAFHCCVCAEAPTALGHLRSQLLSRTAGETSACPLSGSSARRLPRGTSSVPSPSRSPFLPPSRSPSVAGAPPHGCLLPSWGSSGLLPHSAGG